jgi:hypothetical protein
MRRTSKAVFLPASDEPYVFVEALPDATSARALRRILPLMNLYRARDSSASEARLPIRLLTIAESETEVRTTSVVEYTSEPAPDRTTRSSIRVDLGS